MLLAGLFRTLEQKNLFKLGWFSYAFAEITDVKNSETKSSIPGNHFQRVIYPDFDKNQAGLFAFRQIFHHYSQTKKTCLIKANPPGQIRQSFRKVARLTDGSVFLRQTTNPIIDGAVVRFSRKKLRFSRERLRFWGTFLRTFFRRLSSNALKKPGMYIAPFFDELQRNRVIEKQT